ncbi:S-layer homology domain-containing protein [Salibacterium qingdaonense]|uniref:S-layer homology domain-containing protein n=2 Tax=Salibacterium qingdaonense TaxID=266892 RepID=A0A1I4LAB7_9BACI|nr:S-layer homology domain-containing protein [Salibacterium qingdaonense]
MKFWKKAGLSCITAFFMTTGMVSANEDFSDVHSDFWAENEITFLAGEGVISGYPNGEFRPGNEVTRSQAALMIAASLNLDTGDRPSPGFEDVDESSHAYEAIAAVADEGIINGDDGAFMPNDPLTRGQMAAVLTRAYNLNADRTVDFADIEEDYIFYHDIQALAGADIATGYAEDNTFRPGEPTTRAQFSVFTARAMNEEYRPEPVETPSLAFFQGHITEAEAAIEDVMYNEWEKSFENDEPKVPFEEIEDTFHTYYTEELTTQMWKPFYQDGLDDYGPALAQVFPFRSMEGISFESRSANEVVISGTEPETELNNQATYYEYTLVHENGTWLISDMEGTPQ